MTTNGHQEELTTPNPKPQPYTPLVTATRGHGSYDEIAEDEFLKASISQPVGMYERAYGCLNAYLGFGAVSGFSGV